MSYPGILIVEDEAVVAMELEEGLRALGYTVLDTVRTGEDALERSVRLKPDLVLMDIRLAGEMDGIEAAEQIRSAQQVPVIYLTAYADEATVQRAKVTEPFGYLLKPFSRPELRATIEVALHRQGRAGTSRQTVRWLSTVLEKRHEAVIVTDPAGRIKHLSSEAEKLVGVTQAKAEGRHVNDILVIESTVDERTVDVAAWADATVVSSLPSTFVLRSHNGSEIPIDLSATTLTDEAGATSELLLVFRTSHQEKTDKEEQFFEVFQSAEDAEKLSLLGQIACARGEFEDAESYYAKALGIYENTGGEKSLDMANVLDMLACIYDGLGKKESAYEFRMRAERIRDEHED